MTSPFIKDILTVAEGNYIIPTDGNINLVIITCLDEGTTATVYQCESLEQANSL